MSWATLREGPPLAFQVPWVIGRYYGSPGMLALTTGTDTTRVRLAPVYVPNPAGVTATSLNVEMTVAGGAGTLARLALYKMDLKRPQFVGALLVDGGTVAADGAAGGRAAVISRFLAQGWYWAAFTSNGGTFRSYNNTPLLDLANFGIQRPRMTTIFQSFLVFADANTVSDIVANGFPPSLNVVNDDNQGPEGTGCARVLIGV